MAGKFWERKDFSIRQFNALYGKVYDLYYDATSETNEREMMLEGERLMQDAGNRPLLQKWVDLVQDIFTSDRELAAFATTYGIYQQVYNNK